MPVFEYKGVNASGKAIKGVLDADSPKSLRDTLRQKGVFVSDVKETRGEVPTGGAASSAAVSRPSRFRRGVKVQELAEVTRQLATLLRAAIPIVDALGAVAKQISNPSFQLVMNEVRRSVAEGKGLGASMADHPSVFSDLFVNMVKAGESSGTLDVVFDRLADFTESQARLRSKVMSAMMYPIIMMVVGTGIVSLLMVFVVPKMTQMFEEMGGKLPALTRGLIAISGFLENWWHLSLAAIVLFVFWFNKFRKGAGRKAWDSFALRAPVFGPIVKMVSVARFTSTLGTLLNSGVPIVAALEITKHVVSNLVLAQVVDDAKEAVKEGDSLAKPLERSGHFPPMVCHMISVGEASGSLEEMLNNISKSYEEQVNNKLSMLTSLLEPVMIVGMGVVVALIVFAILTPMLQMNQLLKG